MKWLRINRAAPPRSTEGSECNQLRIAVLTTRSRRLEHWETWQNIDWTRNDEAKMLDSGHTVNLVLTDSSSPFGDYWWLLMIIYKLPRYHRICKCSIPQAILPTISYNDLRICPHSMLKLVLIIWSLLSKPLYIVSVFKVNSWDTRGSQNFNSIFCDSGEAYIYIYDIVY